MINCSRGSYSRWEVWREEEGQRLVGILLRMITSLLWYRVLLSSTRVYGTRGSEWDKWLGVKTVIIATSGPWLLRWGGSGGAFTLWILTVIGTGEKSTSCVRFSGVQCLEYRYWADSGGRNTSLQPITNSYGSYVILSEVVILSGGDYMLCYSVYAGNPSFALLSTKRRSNLRLRFCRKRELGVWWTYKSGGCFEAGHVTR